MTWITACDVTDKELHKLALKIPFVFSKESCIDRLTEEEFEMQLRFRGKDASTLSRSQGIKMLMGGLQVTVAPVDRRSR